MKRDKAKHQELMESLMAPDFDKHLLEEKVDALLQINNSMHAPAMVAQILSVFDDESQIEHFENLKETINSYVGNCARAYVPTIFNLHGQLKAGKFSEKKKLEYNDADNRAFYIPNREREVFCVESQNFNFVYILQQSGFTGAQDALEQKGLPAKDYILHIRQYWNRFDPEYSFDKDSEYASGGVSHAIVRADRLLDYSDNIGKNRFVNRPDLRWFKHKGFDMDFHQDQHMTKYCSYGDLRDKGYVLSFDTSNKFRGIVEGAAFFLPVISSALFELNCLKTELEEL